MRYLVDSRDENVGQQPKGLDGTESEKLEMSMLERRREAEVKRAVLSWKLAEETRRQAEIERRRTVEAGRRVDRAAQDRDAEEVRQAWQTIISGTQIASKGFTWRKNMEPWDVENCRDAAAGNEDARIKKQVAGGGSAGNEDEFVENQIAGGGMCDLDDSRNRAVTGDLQPNSKLLESHLR